MIQRLNCPGCNQPANPIFARPYALPALRGMIAASGLGPKLDGRDYEVRACTACELHFQTWVMSDDELGHWYSPPRDDASFMREIGAQKLHWFAHQTEEILVLRQVCGAKTPQVLDFGCNWGKWASMALAHGCEVYGVDVNRDAVRFCANRGIKMVSFEEARAHRFDFVNVDQVVEHLSAPLEVARALAGCLKPGGLIKLSTPHNPALPARLRASRLDDNRVLDARTLDALFPLMHVNLFTPDSLRMLAAGVGLREFRQPFLTWLGAGQLWNIPRQLNRNLTVPFKRWRGRGTYLWFQNENGSKAES